ncbi:MAG TPA: hypothetical protein VHD15_13770 [Hyphomicrobiales bacterium]|nr:hypothetical protein [Hyphomicrobiales bacterium]
MSVYEVNYLCRELLRDKAFREKMKTDPKAALAARDLTEEERAALLGGDVGKLYRMGANSFLMGYLPRFEACGITLPVYNERMRAEAPPQAQ